MPNLDCDYTPKKSYIETDTSTAITTITSTNLDMQKELKSPTQSFQSLQNIAVLDLILHIGSL